MFPEHLLYDKHSAGHTHTVTTAQSLTSEFAQSSGGRKAFRSMPASQGWKVLEVRRESRAHCRPEDS